MTDVDPMARRVRYDTLLRRYMPRANAEQWKAWSDVLQQTDLPPMVTWRGSCQCRVGRLYLSPRGWLWMPDRFHVNRAEWEARGKDPTAYNRNHGIIAHSDQMFPIEGDWPAGAIEVGCEHGSVTAPIDDLRHDAAEVRATHRRVERIVALKE
ncbi:hypothetical protein [Mycolicibacterium sp.]|uniref:hypothetical protein n=1 Tax=Mycolicibacterium sp. TaxID=2320850 RepID=UPI0037C84B81